MLMTFFAAVVAALVYFGPELDPGLALTFQWGGSVLVPFVALFFVGSALSPFQRMNRQLSSRSVAVVRQSGMFLYRLVPPLLLPFVSLALNQFLPGKIGFIVFLVLLGVLVDFLRVIISQILADLDPYVVLERMATCGVDSGKKGDLDGIILAIDGLGEAAANGCIQGRFGLASYALRESYRLGSEFLAFVATAKATQLQKSYGADANDRIAYVFLCLCQRLESVNDVAVKEGITSLSGDVMKTLGKLVVDSSISGRDLSGLPIQCIVTGVNKAVSLGAEDVCAKAMVTLQEVVRTLIVDRKLVEDALIGPVIGICSHMEQMAKESFKRDKTLNVQLLAQPFRAIKELIQEPVYKERQDLEVILRDIDRILSEFSALELVMLKMPEAAKYKPGEFQESPEEEEPEPEESKS